VRTIQRAAIYFAAAALGGLCVVLTAWAFGRYGIADIFGVKIKPQLAKGLIYKQVVWGGLWGFIFLLPFRFRFWWIKGLVLTLAPVIAALVYFIPARGGAMFALHAGALAPVYIYLINIPWGLVTAFLGRMLKADG